MSYLLLVNVILVSFCSIATCDELHQRDWLITPVSSFPNVSLSDADSCLFNPGFTCIILNNGLISRTFVISPNFFTISYQSHLVTPNTEIIRSFAPEAVVGFDFVNYSIGGVSYIDNSNTTAAFWDSSFLSLDDIQINDTTFKYVSHSTSSVLTTLYDWTPGTRHSFKYLSWPPKGLQLSIMFRPGVTAPGALKDIRVVVEYELLQGMPFLTKRLLIKSSNAIATNELLITYLQVEYLKTNLPFGAGGLLWVGTDFAHTSYVSWFEDPDKTMYKANNYGGHEPVVISYFSNPRTDYWAVQLDKDLPGTLDGTFVSFRTLEIVFDDRDMERQGLARRRLMTVLSPAVTESPIYTQTTNMSNASLHRIIDQCAATGFELLAFSFGSAFNMETENQTELQFYQYIIEYANSKKVEIGGYDLEDMARNISKYNRIDANGQPQTGLCFASEWVNNVTQHYNNFVDRGMTMIITDGPYPGWTCASTKHKYHRDAHDSTFRQQYLQNEWYLYFNSKGVYTHSPDSYYYYGINRNKYPYNEKTTTLPRWWDLTIYRQLMYDSSYVIPVTAGWMFLPMTPYHDGDADAIFEPLHKNLDDYWFALGQYFSYSVAATIRGYELYDTNETFQVVKHWTDYYKLHRAILMSDIIHIRRPDNQYLDAILHVNHYLPQECAMLIVFNPLQQTIVNASVEVSLYYSGAKDHIQISYMDSGYRTVLLENSYWLTLDVTIGARSISWWTFSCA